MKKHILLFVIYLSLNSCENSNYKFSAAETEQFLNEVTKNAKATITDRTEIDKQPTNLLGIITRYPLPHNKVEEYNKNGFLKNDDNDIDDFAVYNLKAYELVNEKNEKLQVTNDAKKQNLLSLPLWDYNNVLCQQLGIRIELNKNFEKLKGYVTVEFQMVNGAKKETKIPVELTIYDKIPE